VELVTSLLYRTSYFITQNTSINNAYNGTLQLCSHPKDSIKEYSFLSADDMYSGTDSLMLWRNIWLLSVGK